MRNFLTMVVVCLSLNASAHEVGGSWDGRVTCGGIEHAIHLDLVKDGGTLEMPDLYVAGERIADVRTTPASLTFAFRDARFRGTVERNRIFGLVDAPGTQGATFEVVRRLRPILPYRILESGKLYLPNGAGPFPAIVLAPAPESRFLAHRFATAGIAAFIGDATERSDILRSRTGTLTFGNTPMKQEGAFSIVASHQPPADRRALFIRLPQGQSGCAWFGAEHAEAWIDRAIAWSRQQPKPVVAPAYDEAADAARFGEKAKALALLDRAIEEGFNDTAFLERDEDFAALRDESGFASIVRKSQMLELHCDRGAPLTCWQEALPRLEQAEIEYPHSGRAAFNLAVAAEKTGDHATAAAAYAEAAAVRYKPLETAYGATLAFGRSGDRAQMLRWLERALQLGLPIQRLLADADFAPFRDDAEVKNLITRYGTNWPD